MWKNIKVIVIFCFASVLLLVGTVSAKYNTEIPASTLKLNITVGPIIVTNNDELIEARESGKDYIVMGGNYTSQIRANGVNVTVDNATIDYNGIGALKETNGGTLTINNATVNTQYNTMGAIQVANNSKVIINGGTYSRYVIFAGDSTSTVEINGGTFIYDNPPMGGINGYFGQQEVGTIIIKGGTFDTDPSEYVADGYTAVKNSDGTYTVVCAHPGSNFTTTPTNHSGTCAICDEFDEKHLFDENGLCLICGYQTIVNSTQLAEAVAAGAGTADNPVIIGDGEREKDDVWTEWNPDTSKRLTLNIYDGTFNDWLMYVSNSDVFIYGGVFETDCFYQNNATITICGGDWTAIDSFTFTEASSATIKGGTFGFDPSAYVPTGYTVNDNGDGTWTVVPDVNATE